MGSTAGSSGDSTDLVTKKPVATSRKTWRRKAKIPNMEKFVLLGVVMTVLGSATAGPVLGGTKCTWGPSYWCANIPQASQCSAIKHCVSAVWEKEKVPQDDDEVCKICKDMVGEARDTLMSNETQRELTRCWKRFKCRELFNM